MNRAKDISYCEKFRVYGKLLTNLQADITEMYYMLDLSLSEIAEIKGVSRQSVSCALRNIRAELDEMENVVGFIAKKKAISDFALTLPEQEKTALTSILED